VAVEEAPRDHLSLSRTTSRRQAGFRVNHMKTLTVRLPEALVAQIEAESRRRRLSKSDVVRERLTGAQGSRPQQPALLDEAPRPFSLPNSGFSTLGYAETRVRCW
jgi:Arc/MetJ-type ribon-helix-helix transcriptional regulator